MTYGVSSGRLEVEAQAALIRCVAEGAESGSLFGGFIAPM